jgi:hypothetical protein
MSDSLTRSHKGAPLGTEEDGVDEAGSTTQSPFITTPQLLDSDPDAEGDGAVADNSSMSSSRTRSGSSRSGSTGAGGSRAQVTPRADANGTTAKDDSKSEAAAEPDSEAAKPAKPAKAAPMPADGISGRPSFTPAAAASSASQAARSSSTSSSTPASSYQPSSSSYSPPNYSRSSWSSTPDTATATVTADSAGFGAPTGANRTQSAPSNGGGGFSSTAAGAAAGLSGAAAGLGGAAAGLASSVTAAFRGGSGPKTASAAKDRSAPKIKVRRSSKRQAMLTLSRVEPWSVMKFSFVASVVAFIILFVAVAVLYMVLSALGVFDSLENQVASITSAKNTAGTNISHWFSASLILGYTAMLGALNIVLITALSTIGSVIYNLIAKTVGGIEVTLRETD